VATLRRGEPILFLTCRSIDLTGGPA